MFVGVRVFVCGWLVCVCVLACVHVRVCLCLHIYVDLSLSLSFYPTLSIMYKQFVASRSQITCLFDFAVAADIPVLSSIMRVSLLAVRIRFTLV